MKKLLLSLGILFVFLGAHAQCTVYATAGASGPCQIQFYGTGAGISNIMWYFGDGGSDIGMTPAPHTYPMDGVYTACAIGIDFGGSPCDTFCFPVTVSGCSSSVCNVNATSTYIDSCTQQFAATGASSYSWDFGDGGMASGANPAHSYAADGTYTVCVTGYDSTGIVCDTSCFPLTISGCSTPPCTVYTTYTTLAPCTLQFYATGTSGGIYSWDFGDGGTGSGSSPSHTYTSNGVYTVCCIAYSSPGVACDTACFPVTVSSCGGSSCSITPYYTFTGPCTAYLYVTGSGASTYTWDFGDGSIGTGATASHTYASNGTYTACCVAYTAGGSPCDTACIVVNVTSCGAASCTVNATYTMTGPCQAQFITSGSGAAAYSWTFGDGGVGAGASPTHTYASNGAYTACVTAIDSMGLVCDTSCITVNVTSCTSGLNEFSDEAGVQLFPNPSQGHITIEAPHLNISAFRIYDVAGKLIRSAAVSSASFGISLQEMEAGMYTILMYGADGRLLAAKRFVRER